MMVPRSYMYSSSPPKPGTRHGSGCNSRSDEDQDALKKIGTMAKTTRLGPLPSALSPAPPTPSTPVVIPTRTKHGARGASQVKEVHAQKRKSKSGDQHDPKSLSPSTAALLAITTIPEQNGRMAMGSRPRPIDSTSRRVRENHVPKGSLSSSSPQTWDFLLRAPQDCDSESSSFKSDATLGPLPSLRSLSTESMPSLAEDEGSISSMSDPATPALPCSSSRNERRKQSLSTSVGEDCALDHPLLPPPAGNDLIINEDNDDLPGPEQPAPPAKHKTSFKSNLTASFRAIRSAARSISDLTGPLPQRDDLLSRSVLSMNVPFTDERRPLPSLDPPGPALRRYLNPITLSPAELHFHNGAETEQHIKCSIQLQTCQPGSRRSSKSSSPPIFLSNDREPCNRRNSHLSKSSLNVENAQTSSTSPRQREPRENSDFLRVIVLEMNMRKVGKLTDSTPGRAKLWLPARQVGKKAAAHALEAKRQEEIEKVGAGKRVRVPARWASV